MNCKRCGCYIGEYSGKITGKGGRPPIYCRKCAYAMNLKNAADLLASKRAYFEELGTTNMDSEMSKDKDGKPNFKKEAAIIRKELRELGVRK